MAPDAYTAARVHREIKQLIMAGKFQPGLPLVAHTLADRFGTSISPVRDALNRLVGERLVDMQGGGGFALPTISRRSAFHLYSWHADIVRLIVKVMIRFDEIGAPPVALVTKRADGAAIAAAAAEFFSLLAGCSPNGEHLDAIIQAGERLAVLRLHEGGSDGRVKNSRRSGMSPVRATEMRRVSRCGNITVDVCYTLMRFHWLPPEE